MSRPALWRSVPVPFVIAVVTILAPQPVEAAQILITGTFERGSPNSNSSLKDGSFALTLAVTDLPVRSGGELFLDRFELVLHSATGAVLADLNDLQAGSFGVIQSLTRGRAGDQLKVSNSISHTDLFLLLPTGFTGTGAVIRSSTYSYGVVHGTDPLAVQAGTTAIAPEPPVLACCLAGLLVLGGGGWNRKRLLSLTLSILQSIVDRG